MLEHLFADIAWPPVEVLPRWPVGPGGGGRHLVDRLIRSTEASLLMEIGVFLGMSARHWLATHPGLTVIGIDPWDARLADQCRRYVGRDTLNRVTSDPEAQARFVRDVEEHGVMALALANLQDWRSRFLPVQASSPEVMMALKSAGVEPDVIFIDADKKPEDLEVCHLFWPDARLAGDDWHWGRTKGYPMRRIVQAFAEARGMTVEAEDATWVLHPDTA